MDKCNLHTILRLPTGIFIAKASKLTSSSSRRAPDNPGPRQNFTQPSGLRYAPICRPSVNPPHPGALCPFITTMAVTRTVSHPQRRGLATVGEFTGIDAGAGLKPPLAQLLAGGIRDNKSDSLDISCFKGSKQRRCRQFA